MLFIDILGVVLIFVMCPVMLFGLAAETKSGFVGRDLVPLIRALVGAGAWAIPFLLALVGAVLIAGPLKVVPRHIGIGGLMLFVTFIAGRSLAATMNELSPKDYLGGGWIGDGVATVVLKLFGNASPWVLFGLGTISVVVIVNTPMSLLITRVREWFGDWRIAARERADEIAEARAKSRAAAKPEIKEAVEKSRKRTISSMFGRENGKEEEPEVETAVAIQVPPPPPPVKISTPAPYKPEIVSGNGGSKTEEPLEPFELGEFKLPPTTLLAEPPPPPPRVESELRENIEIIERTLQEFKVEANVVEISHGPTVARYEIRLAPGIKVNKIVGLADNLAMQLAAIDVRVEAPIPGKAAIGVEVPNRNRGTVGLREIVESKAFRESQGLLTFALGKDVAGRPSIAELGLGQRIPHVLVGGSTNSGKSVCLNTLIASLLFRATPDELKLVLIDPKRVELSLFDGIPHLACPVVRDVKQAAGVLRAITQEMDQRYLRLTGSKSRDIVSYNEKAPPGDRMPYMVVVVDELADLMMQMAAEVEGSIMRIAQLARAVGIHLVVATQRPSVDVITGVIKANIASRIAFSVASHIDSRTILDQKGAERLIGRGDMLFLPQDANKPTRVQGCYISEREIEAVCDFLKEQRKPIFTIQPGQVPGTAGGSGEGDDGLTDEFYEPSVRFVVNTGYCSTSMLQRKFKIGYTRAARIVDSMEQQGIVGALDGAKPRQVLINKADLETLFGGKIVLPFDQPDPQQNADDDEEEFIEEAPPAEEIRFDDDEEEED